MRPRTRREPTARRSALARRRLLQHPVSYAGAALAALSLVVFAFLLILHTLSGAAEAPYAGIIIFVVTPLFLFLGLALIPIGMLFERRRRRRSGTASPRPLPVIDLNDAHHRRTLLVLSAGALLLLFLSVFGSYQTYHLTESVEFCGSACHSVMQPEAVAHQNSPHARVPCVACHVGPGAQWYAQSKLAGTRQLFAVLFDTFPRPLAGPIANMRPARDTCEGCHWPNRFYGGQQKRLARHLTDEDNTPWTIDLLIRTGGGSSATPQEGIHWHMNLANRIEYIARDRERRDIPWVRMTSRDTGEVVEYVSSDQPLSPEERATAEIRVMDCMDCHNRPAHVLLSPSRALDLALEAGRIDATLPSIKRTAVDLLAADYASTPEALKGIEGGILGFYASQHPDLPAQRQAQVSRAASEVQAIYQRNFFPEMKTRWDTFENNAGHLGSPGCFRCHDGRHQSSDGQSIGTECGTCHMILAQGRSGTPSYATSPQGLDFEHPVDIGEAWKSMPCADCHTGVGP